MVKPHQLHAVAEGHTFNAAAGVIYRIEGSNDLQNWTVIEPTVTGQGGVVTRLYFITAHPTRYLRVRRN